MNLLVLSLENDVSFWRQQKTLGQKSKQCELRNCLHCSEQQFCKATVVKLQTTEILAEFSG